MTALFNRTIKKEMSKDNGLGDTIVYTKTASSEDITLRCFIGENHEDTDPSNMDLSVRLNAVYLPFNPSTGDKILWDGRTYTILGDADIIKVVDGCYDLIARIKTHMTGRRR